MWEENNLKCPWLKILKEIGASTFPVFNSKLITILDTLESLKLISHI